MVKDKLIINLVLTGKQKEKFEEIKQICGVTKPNTKILEHCIDSTHQLLLR